MASTSPGRRAGNCASTQPAPPPRPRAAVPSRPTPATARPAAPSPDRTTPPRLLRAFTASWFNPSRRPPDPFDVRLRAHLGRSSRLQQPRLLVIQLRHQPPLHVVADHAVIP